MILPQALLDKLVSFSRRRGISTTDALSLLTSSSRRPKNSEEKRLSTMINLFDKAATLSIGKTVEDGKLPAELTEVCKSPLVVRFDQDGSSCYVAHSRNTCIGLMPKRMQAAEFKVYKDNTELTVYLFPHLPTWLLIVDKDETIRDRVHIDNHRVPIRTYTVSKCGKDTSDLEGLLRGMLIALASAEELLNRRAKPSLAGRKPGKHSSPAEHVRHMFIRHCKSGKQVLVRETVVGQKNRSGIVDVPC